jgi:hypothetical protein
LKFGNSRYRQNNKSFQILTNPELHEHFLTMIKKQ